MKRLLFLVAFLAGLASATHAQRAVTIPLAAGDTIVNTGTASKVLNITYGSNGAVIEVTLTKISGTGAGTIQMQGSNLGVTYTNIGSAYTITNTFPQSSTFFIANPVPAYLKVLSTGSGTESVVQSITYRLPRFQAP